MTIDLISSVKMREREVLPHVFHVIKQKNDKILFLILTGEEEKKLRKDNRVLLS